MAATLYHSATEYIASALTITRGSVSDITAVGIFVTSNPATIPAVSDFTPATLVDGTASPLPALAVAGEVDVLALVGPRGGDLGNTTGLTPATYQVYILVKTATEDVIRRTDTLTIL